MGIAAVDLALGGVIVGSIGAASLAQTVQDPTGWNIIGQGVATFAGALGAVITMHKVLFQPSLEREQQQSAQLINAVQAALVKLTDNSTEMAAAHTRQAAALERLGQRMDNLEREVFRMSPRDLPREVPRTPNGSTG